MKHHTFLLGNNWLVAYLTFISSFAPLSTDMYLPALPHMVETLGADEATVGHTVSGLALCGWWALPRTGIVPKRR